VAPGPCILALLLMAAVVILTVRRHYSHIIKELNRQVQRTRAQVLQWQERREGFSTLLNTLLLETNTGGRIQFLSGWPLRTFLRDCQGESLFTSLDPDHERTVREAFREALGGATVENLDCRFLQAKGSFPVRLTMAPRRRAGGNRVNGVRVVVRDISGEINSRRVLDRKRVLEFTTSRILRSFVRVSARNLEETMGEALASLEKLTTVDRCHIVLLDEEKGGLDWEYQWCAPGTGPVSGESLPCSLDEVPWFRSRMGQTDVLHLASREDLPPHARRDREVLAGMGVASLLVFPLFGEGKTLGFLLVAAVDKPGDWDSDGIRILGVLADVLGTALQRREAGHALEEANRKLMDIISFLPDPTFVIDSERRVVAWNRALEELTGVPGSEMIGQGNFAYAVPFHGEPVPTLVDHFGDVDLGSWRALYDFVEIRGDTLYAETFVPFLKEGKGAYLWLTACPLYDSEGHITGAIESLRDVTYRKKSEEALRASEKRFRRLIETMNDGLVIFAGDGSVSFTNQSFCDMLGHSHEEVLGGRIEDILPVIAENRPRDQGGDWQSEGCAAVEVKVEHEDGQIFSLRISPNYISDARGRYAGGMAIVSDLTRIRLVEARVRALNRELEQKIIAGTHELRATNKALSRSEERFRRIIESLREGYIFYSMDPVGNLTYVSPSYRDLLGYAKPSSFSARMEQWLADPKNRIARANSEKTRLGYRQKAWDLHVEHRDGTPMILEVQEGPVFDGQGQVVSVEGLCRDVTESRRNLELIQEAQKKLIESEKLAALGGLVAGLSHEINTPIGIGVTAASHLVQETAACLGFYKERQLTRQAFESFLESARESAALIQTNLNRAADLLQNFKLVATDQTAARERTFNLSEYLEEVIQSLSPRFRNTGFKISCSCPADLQVHCDPGALYQVITNLVMNSLDHGFEGMLVGEIQVRVVSSDGNIVLEYRDSGNGMNSRVMARLYEPFFTTKRGRGGTGLGMHIVYSNVTQVLGGSITCTSKPGRGTRFTISVPLQAEVEHG